MTLASPTKLTARQYLMLGEDPPGVRLELVHGEISVGPSASRDHSRIEKHLSRILLNHIVENDLGELFGDLDTIFDELNVRCPDILFIAKSRLSLLSGKAINIAPDLCIEILSPSSATTDQVDKLNLYAKHGVPHYWIVDPKARTLDVYVLEGLTYRLTQTAREKDVVRAAPFGDLDLSLSAIWPV